MKISLNWIKDFVDFPAVSYSVKELAELLTIRTCEVEEYGYKNPEMIGLEDVVIGEVVSFKKIEGSEKLHVAHVNIGRSEPIQLIFGSMVEMQVGARVPVAVAPTKLPTGLEVTEKVIMKVKTSGMLCLDQELGLKKKGVSITYFPDTAPGTSLADAVRERDEKKFAHIVIGKVINVVKHPNADRLNVVTVDVGEKELQIVCGGQNLVAGMSVAVALAGAVTTSKDGEKMEIAKVTIRGVESNGMICAEEEIGLPVMTPQNGVCIADMGLILKKMKLPAAPAGTQLFEALNTVDIIFDIDNKSLTHRPDLWSHYGMAREFAAILGSKLKPLSIKVKNSEGGPRVKIECPPQLASRFISGIITGIKVGPSPKWMQQRLTAAGMRPINNIVDITNYVMLELGHPLHAFDRRVVGNDTFVIRTAKPGEVLETLDHKKRTLHPDDMLVTNGETALGLAGIMGGLDSEIKDDTTEIILEVARWNPITLRKTSQRHGLRSDAAARFEKSLDPEYTGFAFQRACQLILKICKGSQLFAGPETDVYPERAKMPEVLLHVDRINKKIGTSLTEKEVAHYLKSLQFEVKRESKGVLRVTVPTFRATKDVSMEDDLIEEVARMYGYEKLAPVLPHLPIKLPTVNVERALKHEIRAILSSKLGFNESIHYSFYGAEEISMFKLPQGLHMEIENPLSVDQTYMRISMLPHLLKATLKNLTHRPKVMQYEIGRTYIKRSTYFPLEQKFITGVVAELKGVGTFYDVLGTVKTFLHEFRAKHISIKESTTPPPYAHPKACADIYSGDVLVATIYEVHPEIMRALGSNNAEASAFEINYTHLVAAGQNPAEYHPISKFPGIEIDVSVLVHQHTQVGQIEQLIESANDGLISGIRLVDIFMDKNLGEDKKSLTYRVLLQSNDRTLTDEEMRTVQQKITERITAAGFSIR